MNPMDNTHMGSNHMKNGDLRLDDTRISMTMDCAFVVG